MVIIRKGVQLAPVVSPAPVVGAAISSTAPMMSFFGYIRDLGLNPIAPDTSGMSDREQNVALREHRELIDDLRVDFYVAVSEGKIIEPDDMEPRSKADIIDFMREQLPIEWTHNEHPGRDLTLGMEIKQSKNDLSIYIIDYVSPAGVTVQLVSGPGSDHLPGRCLISTRSSVWYRRRTDTTTDSGPKKRGRKQSRLDPEGAQPVASAQGKRTATTRKLKVRRK